MIYTVTSIQQLFQSITDKAVNLIKDEKSMVIQVQGEIGTIDETIKYSTLYNVALNEGKEQILMDIPKSLIKEREISSGQFVKVTGIVKSEINTNTRNRLVLKIQVSDLEAAESLSQSNKYKENLDRVQTILRLKTGARPFPLKDNVTITIITAKNAKTEDDLVGGLKPIRDYFQISTKYVNILDKFELAKEITQAKSDILAVIRGGGGESEFKIFNEPEVLEALVKFQGYRMIGIGHTTDNALADIIADFSAPTPANLGVEIKEKYIDYLRMLAKIKAQDAEIKRLTKEIEENERLKATEPITAPVREETQKVKDDKFKQRIIFFILVSALAVLAHIAYKSIF